MEILDNTEYVAIVRKSLAQNISAQIFKELRSQTQPHPQSIEILVALQKTLFPQYRQEIMPKVGLNEEHNTFTLELDVIEPEVNVQYRTGGKSKSQRFLSFLFVLSSSEKNQISIKFPTINAEVELNSGDILIIPPYHEYIFNFREFTENSIKLVTINCCFIY